MRRKKRRGMINEGKEEEKVVGWWRKSKAMKMWKRTRKGEDVIEVQSNVIVMRSKNNCAESWRQTGKNNRKKNMENDRKERKEAMQCQVGPRVA